MARARFIKPEFYKHGDLFDAERASGLPLRLAFAGLWTQCDRAGRFVWKPRELKLDVLPYDDVDFADVLDALERHGFLKSYVVDGKRYGVIPSLVDHQPFHKNEPASKLPEPPIETPVTPTNGERTPAIGRLKPAKDRPRRSTTVTTTTTDTTAVTDTEKEKRPADAGSPPGPRCDVFPRSTCDALFEVWRSEVGAVDYGLFRKKLRPVFPTSYTESELAEGIAVFAMERGNQPSDKRQFWNPEKFAGDVHEYVRLGRQKGTDDNGILTERGRIALLGVPA
jgi:hypothetical protein